MFPDTYRPIINLNFLDEFPNPELSKKRFYISMLFVLTLINLYYWHIDYFHMHTIWYVILYLHALFVYLVVYNALIPVVGDEKHKV